MARRHQIGNIRSYAQGIVFFLVGIPTALAGPGTAKSIFALDGFDASAFSVLEKPRGLDSRKVALGRDLFFDKRLSGDRTLSCASCHQLDRGGADGRRFSVGIGGATGIINAPTVFNAALNFRQFWDGRVATLEEQVDGPLQNPIEMGAKWPEVLSRLEADGSLSARFKGIYGGPVTREAVVDALANFERTLVTLDSPFDRFLNGEKSALSPTQIRGFKKFQSFGCMACHQGANLGGNMYQAFGVTGDYFKDRGGAFPSDDGRFNVTRRESDRRVFRVPTLRNVELTAPYFHDGSAATLESAVKVMARYQLGRILSPEDTRDLSAFLRSLTGITPESAIMESGQ